MLSTPQPTIASESSLTVRCPHCHTPTPLPAGATLSNLTCSACGNCFSLIDEVADELPLSGAFGHFQILQHLGSGGFGSVYQARDTQLDRVVALKIPRRGQLTSAEAGQFLREARTAAQLRHPHIVSVHEVGRQDETFYIVSDFIDGESLAGRLAREPFTARETAAMCQKLARALHHAHELGIVHRDLKPANVLLDQSCEPHITDFGLARREAGEVTLTMDGVVVGTPAYMSPEQARGESHTADRRSDVYSLGVILFEILTGELPFRGNVRMVTEQILTEEPPNPRKLNATVPRDLETITLKCLEKDPARRYSTAKDLADDLGRFLHGELIHARPVSRAERTWRWCRRKKALASLLGTVTALLLVLSIGGPVAGIKQARLTRQAHDELSAKNINQLYQDWYSGNVERVGEELKRHYDIADTNAFLFEWELLRQLYDDSRKTILFKKREFETDFPRFVEFSPDGRWLACGQPGDRVAVYDMAHKSLRQLDNEPAGGAADVAFSRDSSELITVSWTGVINRRDVVTSQVIGRTIECRLEGEEEQIVCMYNSLRLSPDGKIAAVATYNGKLALARLEEGECTRIPAHDGYILALAFSPDGSTLVSSGEDETFKFWDLKSKQVNRPMNSKSFIRDVHFTSDGRRLVVCDGVNGLRILDAASLAELRGLRSEPQDVIFMALYRDDILATVGSDDRIVLWDLEMGIRLATLVGHEGDVEQMAFSPDGMSLASTSADGTVRLWPVGQAIRDAKARTSSSQSWKIDLQFTADGQKLFSCTRPDGSSVEGAGTYVTEWTPTTGESEEIVHQGMHGRCDLALVPGTDQLLCGGPGSLALKSKLSGELIQVLDDNPIHEYQHVAISSNGQWAAGCGHILNRPRETEYLALDPRGNVCFVAVHNLESNEHDFFPLPADTDTWIIRSIVFSPDSKFLVTAGGDGPVLYRVDIFESSNDGFRRVDVDESRHGGDTNSQAQDVAFSADGSLIGIAVYSGFARIWSLSDQKWEAAIRRKNGLYALAFSSDGRILALGDSTGIQLCDLQSQFPLATISVGSRITDLQFSPNGRTLAWAAADGRVDFLRTVPGGPSN
jgi:WD40 repeat protein/tRNA A-37 threonylcarbamoyl transferase component Bud32